MPFRRVYFRFNWTSSRRHHWRISDSYRNDCLQHSELNELLHWCVYLAHHRLSRPDMLTLTSLAGMAIAGAGAGVNELTALAATSEMAPTRKRGAYVSALIFTIVPFCPSVLWAQLIAYYSHWRYVGAFCGAWSAFGLLVTIFFYFPPPRVNSQGLSKKEIIGRIDFVGGFLSITGLIVFLAGLQWGGYMVRLAGYPPSPSSAC